RPFRSLDRKSPTPPAAGLPFQNTSRASLASPWQLDGKCSNRNCSNTLRRAIRKNFPPKNQKREAPQCSVRGFRLSAFSFPPSAYLLLSSTTPPNPAGGLSAPSI